jgi:hypothetical protein
MRHVLASVSALLVCACSYAQIHIGLYNDFQDLTTQNWGGPNCFNVATGGPNGVGDAYMGINADGSGQGGKLATFNVVDWIGNYQAEGVTGITLMMRNPNSVQLEMRIVLFDGVSHARWTSVTPAILAPNSGWTFASFGLAESALVEVLGTSSYSSLITNVERTMIRHDVGPPSSGGTTISGTMGIDNILAVPEPGTACAVALGLCAILVRRRIKIEQPRVKH